jgi:hypothetical protein
MSPSYFSNYSATSIAIAAFAIVLPSYWLISRRQTPNQTNRAGSSATKKAPFTVPDRQLQPPKDDPYTLAEVFYLSFVLITTN